ncbi:MAG TPA: hypothetical protein VNI61_01750, partial [Gemmatimonadales bacterium]|nr:hypothetical protein [Gemmatimonadales bacterium]
MRRLLVLALCWPLGVEAQAVPRADIPPRGAVKVTFDPLIELWDEQFLGGRRVRLDAPLDGDTVGDAYIPLLARLEQDVRTAGDFPGFRTSLGNVVFGLRHERRTTPITAEVGVTDRLSLGIRLPLVRVFTRVALRTDPTGATLGLNPLMTDATAAASYQAFFADFDQALTRLQQNIAGGSYGCPGSAQCAQATAFLAQARGVRDALGRSVYGTGTAPSAPFLPLAASEGGARISANLARIQQELSGTWGVTGFTSAFLMPAEPVDAAGLAAVLADTAYGFGVAPFTATPRRLRYWAGDLEVAARYRIVARSGYAATLGALARIPTGHPDSPNDVLDVPTGDGQLDLEGQLVQELTLPGGLWVNASLRVGVQRPGERERRVAPPDAFLVPRAALARLRWDPGDYVAADLAPMLRLSGHVAVGATLGYLARRRDRHAFLTPQDSMDLALRLGVPTAASVLDAGTASRLVRLGVAATYVGPAVEGGLSVEWQLSA